MGKATKEWIIKRLKESKLKVTPQRVAIIEVLIEKRDLHPSARLVHEEARKRKKSLSLSTTYATLEELARHSIIKTLEFDKMENRYETNIEQHINLICRRCGKILDYKMPLAVDRRDVAKKTGFSVQDTRLEYYGMCRECRTEKMTRADRQQQKR